MHMKAFFTIVISVSLLVLPVSARAFQGTPTFSATPSSVDMRPVAVGVSTPFFGAPPPFFQPLQISNSGTAPLTATFSFSSSEFSFDPATNLVNPVTVAAASSVTGGLQFRPSAAGTSYGEDRAQIEDLQARYLFALDFHDPTLYASDHLGLAATLEIPPVEGSVPPNEVARQ